MARTIAWATLIAGTLDILYAALLSLYFDRSPGDMLRYVASGPIPAASEMGTPGAILGLVTHFILMAIMSTAFVIAARNWPMLTAKPIQWGVIYGLLTYVVMNWIVVPVRFDAPLPPSALSIATQLFAHIVLVGLPIALIAARTLRRPALG